MTSRFACALALAAALALSASRLINAATPASGTLSLTGPPISWDGFIAAAAASPDGESTCVDGTTCDVFTLTLAPGDYRGKRVRYKVAWTNQFNDYDVYVHSGGLSGPVLSPPSGGPPATAEEDTVDVNAVVTAGANDTYTIHVVYFAVTGADPYHATLSLEAIPVITTPTRTAKFVTGSKTGIAFSRNRALYAFGAAQDVEPSIRVDHQGNAYVGGIRGLTGGNDLWRFNLNPASGDYDPFLVAATPQWSANGDVDNPAWKGQPDALAPNNDSDLGADGGGDLDIAVGFRPGTPSAEPPTVATSSLVAANVSVQRSTDRGETITNNPAGNTTVPVDDRQWMEFLGSNTVYLGYREFTGLQATSKYYLNRSDDGGLTYGPAVVAAVGGNTTGNIDVDQRDGTVYFCHQGPGADGNKQVRVAVGHPASLAVTPALFETVVAATGQKQIANLFPVCKVASEEPYTLPTRMAAMRFSCRIHSIRGGRGRRQSASATWGLAAWRCSPGWKPARGRARSRSCGTAPPPPTARTAPAATATAPTGASTSRRRSMPPRARRPSCSRWRAITSSTAPTSASPGSPPAPARTATSPTSSRSRSIRRGWR